MLIKRAYLNPLFNLTSKLLSQQFSVQTQYKFLKLRKILDEELQIYVQQAQELTKYFQTDENGKFIQNSAGEFQIKPENFEEFNLKVQEIDQMKIQIPDMYFSLDELENLGLTLAELETLSPFIKE